MLRLPYRAARELDGVKESINVSGVVAYEKDLYVVLKEEEEERIRRIVEFEIEDLDVPMQVSALIRELPICIFNAISKVQALLFL
jgi:hypothetical protein